MDTFNIKLTEVKNNLYILEFGDTLVAFSYKTPVAIMRNDTAFITNEYHSRTTSRHYGDIAGIWGVDINEAHIDKSTFNRLMDAVARDVSNCMKNRDDYFNQLDKLK